MLNYALIALGLAIAGTITSSLKLYLFGLLGNHSIDKIRIDVYRKTLDMPLGWF